MSNPIPLKSIAGQADTFSVRPMTLVKIEKRLRVLHVGKFYPPHEGGMESHLEALCGELKRSIDLEVLVSSSNGSRTSEALLDGVRVVRLGKLFSLRSAPLCPQMVRRIRESRADLVHLHLPNPGAILAYLASGHRGRLVITYHSDVVRQKVLSRFFDPILRCALNQADAIIVSTSNYVNSSYILPLYEQKCRIIPFGIPVERFQRPNAAEVARLRKLYGHRIVLGVGRLVYYKGFEYLIEAMKFVEGHLVIVGRGPMHAALQQKAVSCGVGKRVTFATNVDDVSPYYHAADVFALSSVARSEAFGIVQLEAMACGKPVVNTNLDTGVTSVSLDGVSGITVPPADPKALGNAITYFLENPLRSREYGFAGRQRVMWHFSLQAMAGQTLALYHEVMSLPRENRFAVASAIGSSSLRTKIAKAPVAARAMAAIASEPIHP